MHVLLLMGRNMKKILLMLIIGLLSSGAFASVYVNGYTNKHGTTVDSYYRAEPGMKNSYPKDYHKNYNSQTRSIKSYKPYGSR